MEVSTKLDRIAELASKIRNEPLNNLSHHLDMALFKEAFRRTSKRGAPGVDGQTVEEYRKNLEENLQGLLNRAKSGTYRAPPVRRAYIPKADGTKTRPIGIPTLEDKILQRAVTMILEAVYEQEFKDFSYGFRPRRSPHQALERLWQGTMKLGGAWVLDLDLKQFFDLVDKRRLREFLAERVNDGVINRLVSKWLNAGVMEEGKLFYPETGTPQGSVISPLLANIYLHHVLDKWWTDWLVPNMLGQGFMVRFADDAIMVFTSRQDINRARRTLPKRLAKFALELNQDKTRIVDFRAPWKRTSRDASSFGRTFDFLAFTHYWGRSRRGRPVVKRKTMAKRLARATKRVNQWLRQYRHSPVWWQHRKLCQKFRGFMAYHGIIGNYRALARLQTRIQVRWRKWLDRRSQRGNMPWRKFHRLLQRYPLPRPKVVHSPFRLAKP